MPTFSRFNSSRLATSSSSTCAASADASASRSHSSNTGWVNSNTRQFYFQRALNTMNTVNGGDFKALKVIFENILFWGKFNFASDNHGRKYTKRLVTVIFSESELLLSSVKTIDYWCIVMVRTYGINFDPKRIVCKVSSFMPKEYTRFFREFSLFLTEHPFTDCSACTEFL